MASGEGLVNSSRNNWGLIVNAEKGLVMARRLQTTLFSEVTITLAGKIDVKARVIFLHQAVDLMLLEYDPSLIHEELRPIRLAENSVQEGKNIYYVAFDNYEKIVVQTVAEHLSDDSINATGAPRFVPMGFQDITLQARIAAKRPSGVLVDEDGTVLGLKCPRSSTDGPSMQILVPANRIKPIISLWEKNELETIRYQDFDVGYIVLADAARKGLSLDWTSRIEAHSSTKRQLLCVGRVPSHCVRSDGKVEPHPLHQDDVILTLNGDLVLQSSHLNYIYKENTILLHVFRQGEERDLVVPTVAAKDLEITELVNFCGAIVHRPSLAVRMVEHPCHSEVYISAVQPGSPANLYSMQLTSFIVAVDGERVSTMADFKRIMAAIPDNKYFTFKTMFWNEPKVSTIKKAAKHFPTYTMVRNPDYSEGTWAIDILPDAIGAEPATEPPS